VKSSSGVVAFLLDRVEMIEMKSAIFESVADGVILTSIDGEIQQVNPAFARMLDRKPTISPGEMQDYIFRGRQGTALTYGASKSRATRWESKRVERAGRRAGSVLLSGATLHRIGASLCRSDLPFLREL
jgi:PAS domain-containing protein